VHEMRSILLYMALFLGGALAVCAALAEPLAQAFAANRVFNAMILAVLLVGIVLNVRQVLHLGPALTWLRAYSKPESRLAVDTRPRLLAPLQRLLTSVHQAGFRLPALTMRTLLDSIRLRLDESREVSRYMTGLLIFLGLLGTFWGLLDTVDAVGAVISGLSAGDDLAAAFAQLKTDLQGPLAGMGTAFSSSLFGLGGALILGFFDLQASHAQNRFYNHLEEWLSDLVHMPAGAAVSEPGEPEPVPAAYAGALSAHVAERLDDLLRLLARGEEQRRADGERLAELGARLAALAPALERLAGDARADDALLEALRRIEALLGQAREEAAAGRDALGDDLRRELRLLARASARGEAATGGAGGC